ncbi:MAG: gliding motility protein GldL [Chitinophagales bacterium]|nr:gliding motility protein GldL [Chitinophagales bacterium]
MIIGVGASVVLLGALFKLQHWPFASEMLIIGMSVEAFIFALQGILPPHKDYYWEKMYPDLDVSPEEEELHGKTGEGLAYSGKVAGGSITQQLDKMLEEANVESTLIQRLGENLGKLGDNIEKLSDVSDAAVATSEYSDNAKEAAGALSAMKDAYHKATEAVGELVSSTSGTKDYHEQVQQISKNLAALNSMYELELQDTNNHLKSMNKFYSSLADAMNNLQEAKSDAMVYKEEMGNLSRNLASLNQVYGNMLNAMGAGAKIAPGAVTNNG